MHNFKDPRMLANYNPPPNLPQQSEGPKPLTPDTSRRQALFGTSDAPGMPAAITGRISGSGAAVVSGLLTFTDTSGARKSYEVVRPKVAIGPQGSGDSGTWLAIDDQMMFTVLGDKTISGQKAPPVLFQMLMQQH